MIFLYLLVLAAAITFWYFVGKEFEQIAGKKGHYDKKYFWWTFFAAPIGIGMVIALPDRAAEAEKNGIVDMNLPEI